METFLGAGPRGASRVQSKLANFVEQCFIADAQHLRRIFSAPVRLFESVRDRFHFGLVLQTAHEGFQSLFTRGHGFFPRRNPLARGGHFQKFAEAAFVVFEDHVAFHEIFEFAKVAGPGITHGGFH